MSDDGHGVWGGTMLGTSSEAAHGNRGDSLSDDDDGAGGGTMSGTSSEAAHGNGGDSLSDDDDGAGGRTMSGTSSEAAHGNRGDSLSDDDDGAGGRTMSGTSSPLSSKPAGRGCSGLWGDQSIPGAKIFTLHDSNTLQKVEHHHGTSILLHTNAVYEVKVIIVISISPAFYLAPLSLTQFSVRFCRYPSDWTPRLSRS
jgi:hypothetical protein